MNLLAAAVLKARIALKYKPHMRRKEGMVASYCEPVNYLLKSYATDHVMDQTEVVE